MTVTTRMRVAGLVLAAVLLAVTVSFSSGGGSGSTLAGARGPERRGEGAGETEPILPPGIVPTEVILAAKDAETTTTSTAVRPRAEAPVTGSKCPTPCVGTSFAALDNASDVSPADPAGAVGDTHVVSAVNISYEIATRTGATQVGPELFENLFPGTGAFVFDPKVIYDQYNDTYVLVFLGVKGTQSWIFTVAIPDATATAKATWCERRIAGDQLRDGIAQMADYPGVGYDGKRVYITTNMFGFSKGYYGAQILAIPTGGLYDCGRKLTMKAFSGRAMLNPDGGKSASLQPAASDGATMPAAEYLVSFDYSCPNTCVGNTMVLWRIKQTSKGLRLAKGEVNVGKAVIPPWGSQKGTTGVNDANYWWDTGDLRVTNAFYDVDRDRLFTAHAVDHGFGDNSYAESSARWYEFDPAGRLSASTNTRTGYVGAPGLDLGWPAVATNSNGVLFMTVSGAGYPADEYLSTYATTVPVASTTPDTLLQTHAGTSVHNWGSGYERWGDYNQINRDPQDPTTTWSFNQTAEVSKFQFQEYVDQLTNV